MLSMKVKITAIILTSTKTVNQSVNQSINQNLLAPKLVILQCYFLKSVNYGTNKSSQQSLLSLQGESACYFRMFLKITWPSCLVFVNQ